MDYLKYYYLEKDFFPQIREFFYDKKYLTPEYFFSIIIWKSNRSRERIKQGLLMDGRPLEVAVRDLSEKIYKTSLREKKLELLLKQRGIQLAIASAILTVLYPKDFTVYDFRVRSKLKNPRDESKPYPDISYAKNKIERYFNEYLKQTKEYNPEKSLRDNDRILWAMSWYEDLEDFIKK